MARYRKVDVRVWVDARVRRLSPLAPSGQALWFYMLTNPMTTNIPGLYRAGEAAMAEELGWPLESFRKAFREVSREGLAEADWGARVVWVRGAAKYNRPESPNVVKSWATALDEIPECGLKTKACQQLGEYLQEIGQAFAEAFAWSCDKPSPKTLPNQEQEQEPEQEQEQEASPRASDAVLEVIAHYRKTHPRAFVKPHGGLKEWKLIAGHLKNGRTVAELCSVIDAYERDPWHQGANDRKTKFNALALYMRDEEHIRKGLEMAQTSNGTTKPGNPMAAVIAKINEGERRP